MSTIQPIACGRAGHFIGAADCSFHLHHRVGNFRVSTVGEYHPFTFRHEAVTLGYQPDSFYETMVFPVTDCDDHMGDADFSAELACERYATAEAAEAGHYLYCEKYAAEALITLATEVDR